MASSNDMRGIISYLEYLKSSLLVNHERLTTLANELEEGRKTKNREIEHLKQKLKAVKGLEEKVEDLRSRLRHYENQNTTLQQNAASGTNKLKDELAKAEEALLIAQGRAAVI